MERKSIGSFISALRKANGMTQKNLAEMLNVSDKAVSRWERDECAPDLSLIPVIAEIFDVTADELLCGERKSSESVNVKTNNTRTEKQKQRLLNSAFEKFRNKSLISLGVSAFAIILGIVVELIFKTYPVTLVFVAIAVVASIICEITFIHNLWLAVDAEEFDDIKTDSLKVKAINFSKRIFAVNYWVLFVAICLEPFVQFCAGEHYKLMGEEYIPYNLYDLFSEYSNRIFSVDGFLIACVYVGIGWIIFKAVWSIILKRLEKSDSYPVDETESKLWGFKRIYSIIFSVVLLLTVAIQTNVLDSSVFDSMSAIVFNDEESFKEFAESSGDGSADIEVYGLTIEFKGSVVGEEADDVSDCRQQFLDENGDVIFEYNHNNADICSISGGSDDIFSINVLTFSQVAYNENFYRMICFAVLVLELSIFAISYKIISNRKKKK